MVVHAALASHNELLTEWPLPPSRDSRRGLLTNEPILLLALVLLGLYFAREVLIPLAMAVTLNFLLAPAVILL